MDCVVPKPKYGRAMRLATRRSLSLGISLISTREFLLVRWLTAGAAAAVVFTVLTVAAPAASATPPAVCDIYFPPVGAAAACVEQPDHAVQECGAAAVFVLEGLQIGVCAIDPPG